MANLLQQVKDTIEPALTREAAGHFGETPDVTRSAIGVAIPALLAGLVSQGSTPSGATRLLDMLSSRDVDAASGANVAGAQGAASRADALLRSGGSMVSSLFGDRTASVTSTIASLSGLDRASSGGLLAMAAPLVMGVLRRHVQTNRLDAGGLANLLSGQRDSLRASLPDSLADAVGLSRPSFTPGATSTISEATQPERVTDGRDAMRRWLPLAGLAALALVVWSLFGHRAERREEPAVEPGPVARAPAPAEIPHRTIGPMRTFTLPNGTSVHAPEGGLVDSLVAYLQPPGGAPGQRFGFDEIVFDVGSPRPSPASLPELEAVAATLKAYPAVKVRIEGHGDTASDISGLGVARADAVKTALVGLGVADARMTTGAGPPEAAGGAEAGRGKTHPIDVVIVGD
jgi:outer membrane protein OmpA-like peptidoglycan-associated protein